MNRYGSCGNAVGMYGRELRPFPGEEVRPNKNKRSGIFK